MLNTFARDTRIVHRTHDIIGVAPKAFATQKFTCFLNYKEEVASSCSALYMCVRSGGMRSLLANEPQGAQMTFH